MTARMPPAKEKMDARANAGILPPPKRASQGPAPIATIICSKVTLVKGKVHHHQQRKLTFPFGIAYANLILY